jgi:two-component system response regulator YesN
MYRILLADDEGIMLESLQSLIEKNFGDECEIECAKSGRTVIEIAERFRPDIAFMDLQMPGINGIQAMREIRSHNDFTIFIVITAYDKFVFAKEAINLGVLEYLTKPVNYKLIIDVLLRAMRIVDDNRLKRSDDLRIREKMEAVLPIIENGFVYSLIFQDDFDGDTNNYKDLLGIQEEYAQMMIVEWGDEVENGHLTNPVGAGVRAHPHYREFREILKEYYTCVPGAMMSNKMAVYIPCAKVPMDYKDRSAMIEKSRSLIRKLRTRVDLRFRIGIGSEKPLHRISESYKEAIKALRYGDQTIMHIEDLSLTCQYEESYPIEIERALFDHIEKGDAAGTKDEASVFFEWMIENYPDCEMDIKLKVIEFVLQAEKKAFAGGGMKYFFRYRSEYLNQILGMKDMLALKTWFIGKMVDACHNISPEKKDQTSSIIEKAKEYINSHYSKELSLEEVSQSIDISPYYFSKLFKDKTGENFIEYLTAVRIESAKRLLQDRKRSVKEICIESGYSDPNYFSRIFKKYEGVTPSEYREKLQ